MLSRLSENIEKIALEVTLTLKTHEERSLWCVMWESGVAKSERRYEGHIGAQNTDEYFLHNFIGYIFLNRISRRNVEKHIKS